MPRERFRLVYTVRMSADESDIAEVMLYGSIVDDDYGPRYKEAYPYDKSATDFKKDIEAVRAKGAKKLRLRINSPGGYVDQAVAMRYILSDAGFSEVKILIEGMCASSATLIATLPGANVQIAEGSQYMIHRPSCGMWGTAEDLETCAKSLRNIEDACVDMYAKRTGQSGEQIREWLNAETWFGAKDAVKYGFADEVKEAKVADGAPAAACVTTNQMAVMHGLYKAVPEQVEVRDESAQEPPKNDVSNGSPNAGEPSEIKNHEEEPSMDIKDINLDQLRAENPALLTEIQQSAVAAERERIADIDALTLPGYEEMAAKAKSDGISAMDFQKQVVQAAKQKGTDFMNKRKKETAAADGVKGGEPNDNGKTEAQEIEDFVKEMVGYAKEYTAVDHGNDGMF